MNNSQVTPDDLWDFAEHFWNSGDRNKPLWSVFDPIGLLPCDNGPTTSPPFPKLAHLFASTGGDGVHFSILRQENVDSLAGLPVLMTVPMAFEQANWIVGANLHEFLCLGCRTGFFSLERIAYDDLRDSEFLGLASKYVPNQDEVPILSALRKRFELHPWDEIPNRIAELQELYLPHIGELNPWPEAE